MRIRKMLGALALTGAAILGTFAVATPASAHSAMNCTHWWLTTGEGAQAHCSGGSAGDSARLRLICQRLGGGPLSTKFSAWFSSGYKTLYCSSGYEVYSNNVNIVYADGHSVWV